MLVALSVLWIFWGVVCKLLSSFKTHTKFLFLLEVFPEPRPLPKSMAFCFLLAALSSDEGLAQCRVV